MILWALVALSISTSITTFLTMERNKAHLKVIKETLKTQGYYSLPLVLLNVLTTGAMSVLWGIYAIQVQDWRFAAIAWLPVLARLLVKGAVHYVPPKAPPATNPPACPICGENRFHEATSPTTARHIHMTAHERARETKPKQG